MVPRLISSVKVATYIKDTGSVASKQRHSLVNAEKLSKEVKHWTRIGSIDLESDDYSMESHTHNIRFGGDTRRIT